MTTMLECAARAAYENWLKRPSTVDEARRGGPFPDWPRCDTDYWYSQARAVLMAVRELDDMTVTRACDQGYYDSGDLGVNFKSTIDAILEGK